jgi:hypothetical protein
VLEADAPVWDQVYAWAAEFKNEDIMADLEAGCIRRRVAIGDQTTWDAGAGRLLTSFSASRVEASPWWNVGPPPWASDEVEEPEETTMGEQSPEAEAPEEAWEPYSAERQRAFDDATFREIVAYTEMMELEAARAALADEQDVFALMSGGEMWADAMGEPHGDS